MPSYRECSRIETKGEAEVDHVKAKKRVLRKAPSSEAWVETVECIINNSLLEIEQYDRVSII